MPSQGIGCFLQYSIRTPVYASERLRQKAVSTEPDKVISAVKRWTNDTISRVEKPERIAKSIFREIWYIATYDNDTAEPPREGVTETMFHSLAKVITFLGQVLVFFSEYLFKAIKGMLWIKADKKGVIIVVQS